MASVRGRRQKKEEAQTALEYMLLMGLVLAVILVGFNKYIPRSRNSAELFFNNVSGGLLGAPPNCENLDNVMC